ncbi:MAG: hypothetical protein L7F78_24695, partial [Syntrophales bacterium LBB04]|nr:hypothetical protein [Syntrophales bacterium LBB04]
MTKELVYGRIQNMETGEIKEVEYCPFYAEFEVTTLVKVEKVESFSFPGGSIQVSADCHGLESIGGVYDVSLEFPPQSIQEREKIVGDLKPASYFLVKGQYSIPKGGPLCIFDPQYRPIEPAFSEDEIREVFRVNSRNHEKP